MVEICAGHENIKALEIGCGPGALAGALQRWYPGAEIMAVDRDSEFIHFAKEYEKGINLTPSCIAFNEYEQQFWEKAEQHDNSMEKYAVCKYPMSEVQLPAAMEKYGFKDIRTGYAIIDLMPDDPNFNVRYPRQNSL